MSATLIIIIILVVIALLLFAVEAFVLTGIGFAGIGAAACVVVADVLVFYEYGATAAISALLAATVLILLFFRWFSQSKALERMELKSTIDSTAATEAQLSVRPGDKGRALTRLALIGNAEINGRRVEVKSAGSFIEEGTSIVVTEVSEALVIVKPTE